MWVRYGALYGAFRSKKGARVAQSGTVSGSRANGVRLGYLGVRRSSRRPDRSSSAPPRAASEARRQRKQNYAAPLTELFGGENWKECRDAENKPQCLMFKFREIVLAGICHYALPYRVFEDEREGCQNPGSMRNPGFDTLHPRRARSCQRMRARASKCSARLRISRRRRSPVETLHETGPSRRDAAPGAALRSGLRR
jgi:hypothetical protein